MLEPYQKKIIELMVKQELLLGRLYTIFADRFPALEKTWLEMAREELKHAEWVKKLYLAEKKELVAFDEGKTRTYTLKIFIENLEKVIRQAQDGEMTIQKAVAYTRDFEMSLIEKNAFARFEVVDERVQGVLTRLQSDTRRHARKAQEMMAAIT